MINVLWVDDEIQNPNICNSFVERAKLHGINVEPYVTYDEAYSALEANPSKWIAIILDVRNDKASVGNENQDYLEMRSKVEAFRNRRGPSVEPYIFVFSADATVLSSAKCFFRKDAETQKKYVYTKPTDTTILLEDIKKVTELSPQYSTYKKHEDVMDAMVKLEWSGENQNLVFNLIKSIEIDNDYKNDSFYNDIRKLIESVLYKKLEEIGLMNEYKYYKDESENETINKRSVYIGGHKEIPTYIKRAFHSLTDNTNNGCHVKEEGKTTNLVVAEHTKHGKAPYLLKSCLYDLLTIIIWESQL